MADPRTEAERLVATALAALAALSAATPTAEGCGCPVCKALSAARDPSPEFAERLASGVGDVATGVASVLRAFGGSAGSAGSRESADQGTDDTWHDATH